MKKIAIIGGGITGMAAAWFLQKHDNVQVVLFEQSARLGGVIETIRQGPYLIEKGADNFATLLPAALELSRELELDSELLIPSEANRLARVVNRGRLLPIPTGFSLMQPTRLDAILATKALSWSGKLRLLAEYWVPRRSSQEDESLKDFATRRLGREAFERLVEPIVGGIFTARADRLSMQAAMPQFISMEQVHGGLIRAWLNSRHQTPEASRHSSAISRRASGARYDQFRAPSLGMQWWLDQLASRLTGVDIRLDSPIHSIQSTIQGWRVSGPDISEHEFSGLILATPAPVSSRLVTNVSSVAAEGLASIEYASSVVVAMVVPRSALRASDLCFGIVIPQIENRRCVAISMTSEKYPGRTPPDQVLLRVFIGGAVRPDLFHENDDELKRIALEEVKEILGVQAAPLWLGVFRWPTSMPQYHLGHVNLVAKIRHALCEHPSLQLAGNAYEGVGIPQCIRSAENAVTNLLSCLGGDHADR